ncbi:hypothetical protein V8E52_005406 [Russula decolorans]
MFTLSCLESLASCRIPTLPSFSTLPWKLTNERPKLLIRSFPGFNPATLLPEAILAVLQEQFPVISQSQNIDDKFTKWAAKGSLSEISITLAGPSSTGVGFEGMEAAAATQLFGLFGHGRHVREEIDVSSVLPLPQTEAPRVSNASQEYRERIETPHETGTE